MTRGVRLALLWLPVALMMEAPSLRAQETTEATLDSVEAALDSGRVLSARKILQGWLAVHEDRANRADMARARFLRARLTQDADSAEVDYLQVAIDGGSPYGSSAWLRLAQLHLARGDPERARHDLERLRAEYPETPLMAESWLWSGFALEAAGDLEKACEAWRQAARETGGALDSDVGRRIQSAREACESKGLHFTVQIGAFRSSETAKSLRMRAKEAGFEARVERLADGLWRVRVGHFSSVESARAMAARLRAGDFSAVIASEGS